MAVIHELIETYIETQDKSILSKILNELQTTEKLWTILVRVTNNFYLGVEREKPSAYLFTEKEFADNFVREVKWGGIQAKCLEIKPEQRISFFNDLYRSGFEAVAIDKGEDSLTMSLFAIIDREEEASEQVILNPHLMRAANQFYQELSRKRAIKPMQDLLCKEIYEGLFLIPTEDILEDGAGRHLLERSEKVAYGTLAAQEGKKFYPVFTDWTEFAKFDKKKRRDAVAIGFKEFKKMIRKVDGIAVNPFGFNLLIDPMKLESIEKLNAEQGSKVISLKDRR